MSEDHSKAAKNTEALAEQSIEFVKEVITVLPGIHCAIGYGLANCMLIEGDEGSIIIDTLESRESALEVFEQFQLISKKPIEAIIYTHHHADHIFGTEIFLGENREKIRIYSHGKSCEIIEQMSSVQPIGYQRAARQFGIFLNEDLGHMNCAIGLKLNISRDGERKFIPPTHQLNDPLTKLKLAGRDLELYHAPGETDDHLIVYLPNEKVLFPADNVYKSFPNIYAIRGTPTRDALQWISSLDLMRNLHAEYLIPSHTRPVRGKEKIASLLRDYRDAIQFVHDQTVRYANLGFTPDQMTKDQLIQLPDRLQQHPYLQQFYGTVDWSIRAIFDRYLGWFSGQASHLNPDPPKIRAKNLIRLAGGPEQVWVQAEKAFAEEAYQWCLELTEALTLCPEQVSKAEIIRLQSLTLNKLASSERSATSRNWYLTQSLEIQGSLDLKPSLKQIQQTVRGTSIRNTLKFFAVRFNYQTAQDIDQLVLVEFLDTKVKVSLHLRNGIVDFQEYWPEEIPQDQTSLIFQVKSEETWKKIVCRELSPTDAIENSDVIVQQNNGESHPEGALLFIQFLLFFIEQ